LHNKGHFTDFAQAMTDGENADRIGTQTGGNRHGPSAFCPRTWPSGFVRQGFLSRHEWKLTAL
jgi:hypothetical protein